MGWFAWLKTTPMATTKASLSTVKGCWMFGSCSVIIVAICICNVVKACYVVGVHVNYLFCSKSVSGDVRVA